MMTLVDNGKKLKDDGKDGDNEPRPLDIKVGYKLGAVPGRLISVYICKIKIEAAASVHVAVHGL